MGVKMKEIMNKVLKEINKIWKKLKSLESRIEMLEREREYNFSGEDDDYELCAKCIFKDRCSNFPVLGECDDFREDKEV